MINKETKKPHINQVELEKWYEMQQQLKELKEAEAELRLKIFKGAFPEPIEGTNKLDLIKGWVLKATYPVTRNVVLDEFLAFKERLVEEHISPDKLVEFKPSLKVGFYKTLTEEEKELVDQFLIIKEGSPQMEIVLPKSAKKNDKDYV